MLTQQKLLLSVRQLCSDCSHAAISFSFFAFLPWEVVSFHNSNNFCFPLTVKETEPTGEEESEEGRGKHIPGK